MSTKLEVLWRPARNAEPRLSLCICTQITCYYFSRWMEKLYVGGETSCLAINMLTMRFNVIRYQRFCDKLMPRRHQCFTIDDGNIWGCALIIKACRKCVVQDLRTRYCGWLNVIKNSNKKYKCRFFGPSTVLRPRLPRED